MLNITAPEFIERQAMMNRAGCKLSPAMIDALMKFDNAKLHALIANARQSIPTLTDQRLDTATRALAAMEIEANLRGLAV